MTPANNIWLAYYGDDFTGSTDALEFATRAGAKAILFLDPPNADMLNRFGNPDVIGVAGKTRALSPTDMEAQLLPAFSALQKLQPMHVHYKVCSTFDSSAHIGSIGKAIDCGVNIFGRRCIPVIGGAPVLGRYCVFGNLFARMGIGSNGNIYRLDRHPSMSKHPVTPADESDLRLHLAKQTTQSMDLVDVVALENSSATWGKKTKHEGVLLFDVLTENHLQSIGHWLYEQGAALPFSVGGSSVEMALGYAWQQHKLCEERTNWTAPGEVSPLLVVSGSCSPVTAAQITWAKSQGFVDIKIDATGIAENGGYDENATKAAVDQLQQGRHVIVHTGDFKEKNLPSEKLGTCLGMIARMAMASFPVKRLVIAGGDTSSYAARALQIEAVEMIAPIVVGAPLCRAYAADPAIDGLQVNFKGGQVGGEDYFGLLQQGNWKYQA